MKQFLRKHIWLFLIIALAVLFPQSLSSQAELNMRMIIAGIGIDYVDNNYEVTAEVVLPSKSSEKSGISAKINFVSDKNATISGAVNAVSKKYGKIAELSHLEYVVVGNGFENKNVASELDYFFRNFKLKNSIMLLSCANSSAKETLKKVGGLDMGVALSMQKVYIANEEGLNSVAKKYVDFVADSLSVSGISVLDTLEFEESEDSGTQSGEETQQKQSQLKTLSPLKIYKNGMFSMQIDDKNQVLAYYFLNRKSKSGNYQISSFSYGDILDANINMRIDNFSKQKSVKFDTPFPTLQIKIKIDEAHIDEIASKNLNSKLFAAYMQKNTQEEIIKAVSGSIKQNIYSLFDLAKANNIDIFEIGNACQKYEKQKWQQYLEKLEDKQNYLENCNLDILVEFDKIR